ncbi:hypothetical protein ACMG5I_02875 [Escherichia coli]|uniref:hypothetical protein n=1 Tax=Escherichia coli TaxID=562 RepID=UPI0039BF33AB
MTSKYCEFEINKLREWFYNIEIEAIPYHTYEQSDLQSIDIRELYKYYQSALEMHKLFLSTKFFMQYNFDEYNNYNLVQKYVVAKYMYIQGIKGCIEFNTVLALVEVILCTACACLI